MKSTEDIVKRLFAEQLAMNSDDVNLKADMQLEYEVDSLDRIELIFELEDEFDIEIPDEDAEGIETLQQVIDYINERLGAQGSAVSAGL